MNGLLAPDKRWTCRFAIVPSERGYWAVPEYKSCNRVHPQEAQKGHRVACRWDLWTASHLLHRLHGLLLPPCLPQPSTKPRQRQTQHQDCDEQCSQSELKPAAFGNTLGHGSRWLSPWWTTDRCVHTKTWNGEDAHALTGLMNTRPGNRESPLGASQRLVG